MSKLFARDLDGTGSLHICAKGDPGAIEFAAIDGEIREALEAAITFFDSFKDYRISAHDPEKDHMAKLIQEVHQSVIEMHIAALQRLIEA